MYGFQIKINNKENIAKLRSMKIKNGKHYINLIIKSNNPIRDYKELKKNGFKGVRIESRNVAFAVDDGLINCIDHDGFLDDFLARKKDGNYPLNLG